MITRLALYGGARPPYGSFAGKTPGPSDDLIAQARASAQFLFGRIFGRVN